MAKERGRRRDLCHGAKQPRLAVNLLIFFRAVNACPLRNTKDFVHILL